MTHKNSRVDTPVSTSFISKAKANPIKTATAVLSLIATISGMVFATLNFVATKADVRTLSKEMIDVAIMAYEDSLLATEYRAASTQSSDFDAILIKHYQRRIASLKELKD